MSRYKGLAYLIGLVVVAPWLAYNLAIAKTVGQAREARRAGREIVMLESRSVDTPVVKSEPKLGNGAIMARVAGGGCEVVKYTPYITDSRDGLTVHTAEMVVSGGYTDLVRLVERVEKESRLVSVMFGSTKNGLQATLILQEITGS